MDLNGIRSSSIEVVAVFGQRLNLYFNSSSGSTSMLTGISSYAANNVAI